MQSLSARARRELALLHAIDSLRVLAAVAVPLHVLPLACVLYALLNLEFALTVLTIVWAGVAIVLHALLIRSAENLLDRPKQSVQFALGAATLLLLVMLGGQVLLSMAYGVGLLLVILLACGLFDALTLGALIYATWSCLRSFVRPADPPTERHLGFEVVLPEAQYRDEA